MRFALVVLLSGCVATMTPHRGEQPPLCTESALPVAADAAMALAGASLMAGGIYATKTCDSDVPEACAHGAAVGVGSLIMVTAAVATVVGAVRRGNCRDAYVGEPASAPRVRPSWLVYASFAADALLAALAVTVAAD